MSFTEGERVDIQDIMDWLFGDEPEQRPVPMLPPARPATELGDEVLHMLMHREYGFCIRMGCDFVDERDFIDEDERHEYVIESPYSKAAQQ